LAFAGVSDKAWARVPSARLPKFYFSFTAEKKAIEKNQSAYTPPSPSWWGCARACA